MMSTVVARVNGVLYGDPATLAKNNAVMVDIINNGHRSSVDARPRRPCSRAIKKLAGISQRQSKLTKGSCRWTCLQRRTAHLRAEARRRITGLVHKATRQVSDAFAGATCYVGKPFNDAAQTRAPRRAQTVSQACTTRIIEPLDYKTRGAIQVTPCRSRRTGSD
jgi:hypothetical protein